MHSNFTFYNYPPHFYLSKNKVVTANTPVLLFGLWCLYVLLQYFNHRATLVFSIYSFVLYFLLLKASYYFSSPSFKFKPFFIGIAGISSIESAICVLQFLGWDKSQNNLFAVTGSWNNPNVTAIFLALTVPVFLFLLRYSHKKITLTGLFFLLTALFLLKCRAAYIGTLLSIVFFYGLEYKVINWFKDKKNRTSAKLLLTLCLLITISISSRLYDAKRASADGRKFIWKISSIMATQKPITGFGYGHFEKEYNLYQVKYIQNGKATTEELANAGPVIMPHNEILLNLVEGGSIGLLLISLFIGSLLFSIKHKKTIHKNKLNNENTEQTQKSLYHLAYAGIVAFIGMSLVNSTMQIVPIMCLFVIYAAIICSTINPIAFPQSLSFIENNKVVAILSKTTIIIISIYLSYLLYGMANADRQNKKAKLLEESGHYEQALKIMPALNPHLKEHSDYWENYGMLHFKTQNFQQAANDFKKAQTLSSLPEVYLGAGKSYEKLYQYPKAIQEYEILVNLYPSKFLYRMILLETYLKNKNSQKAILLAQEIILLQPKIPSEKVNRYKSMCRNLLKKIAPQKETIKKFNANFNSNIKNSIYK